MSRYYENSWRELKARERKEELEALKQEHIELAKFSEWLMDETAESRISKRLSDKKVGVSRYEKIAHCYIVFYNPKERRGIAIRFKKRMENLNKKDFELAMTYFESKEGRKHLVCVDKHFKHNWNFNTRTYLMPTFKQTTMKIEACVFGIKRWIYRDLAKTKLPLVELYKHYFSQANIKIVETLA